MKRRKFIAAGSGIVAGQIATSAPGTAQTGTTALAISRTSRLFDNTHTSPKTFVQDVLYWNDILYCLYTDASTHYWGLTGITPGGKQAFRYDLPSGVYLGIGLHAGSILLNALTYYDTSGNAQPNCIVGLGGAGGLELLESLGQSFTGRLVFAGDSRLLHIDGGTIEVWSSVNGVFSRGPAKAINPLFAQPNIDLLAPDRLAITRKDGSGITVIDLPSGSPQEHPIAVPAVNDAITKYQRQATPGRGNPVVIPATGADQMGLLYALVLPSPRSAVQTVTITPSGTGSTWREVQFPPRAGSISGAPIKLVVSSTEFGIVYTDGSVAWYAV